jgi:hypothetical protein
MDKPPKTITLDIRQEDRTPRFIKLNVVTEGPQSPQRIQLGAVGFAWIHVEKAAAAGDRVELRKSLLHLRRMITESLKSDALKMTTATEIESQESFEVRQAQLRRAGKEIDEAMELREDAILALIDAQENLDRVLDVWRPVFDEVQQRNELAIAELRRT